ncbi:hypothetical protein [Tenggerimyces flavus]|uniref:Uncharacterized protein n=1 Tax=Tenggerimyces flavus TaxID=1708749 RepID=A0ABV7YCD2_9ACTN|nr:hypothetical protein [Tenggerimyces flavus]MBM7783740.1 hypothetical protein [Tenggerimyces flavus]
MDGELRPLLGPPVEPPEDVWAAALAGALDDPREAGELAALVPDSEAATPEVLPAEALDEEPGDLVADEPEWAAEEGPDLEQHVDGPGDDDAGWLA